MRSVPRLGRPGAVPAIGRRDPAEWITVNRSRTLVSAAAVVALLGACGLDDRASGIDAVASDPLEIDATIDSTAAEAVSAVPRPRTAAESALADEVETLVEPTEARPSTVAVVGDSLARSAEEEILLSLVRRGLHVVAIDALESRRMSHGGSRLPPGTEAVDAIRAEGAPGVWVVALGTNDVASDTSLADFRAEMRDVLDRIPVDDPVIWVDLWIGGEEELVARANRMIRVELRRRRGGTAVVDWYSHGTDAGVITADGVHLTQTGQDLFAESIAVAVDELFAD